MGFRAAGSSRVGSSAIEGERERPEHYRRTSSPPTPVNSRLHVHTRARALEVDVGRGLGWAGEGRPDLLGDGGGREVETADIVFKEHLLGLLLAIKTLLSQRQTPEIAFSGSLWSLLLLGAQKRGVRASCEVGTGEGDCRRRCKVWEEREPDTIGNREGGYCQNHTGFTRRRTRFESRASCYCVTLPKSLALSQPLSPIIWTLQASDESKSLQGPHWWLV